jgi:hypothetical protein
MKSILSICILFCSLKLVAQNACGTSTPNTTTTNPHNNDNYNYSTSPYNPNAKNGPLYFDWTNPNVPIPFYSSSPLHNCNLISPFFANSQGSLPGSNLCVSQGPSADGGIHDPNILMYGNTAGISTMSVNEKLKAMDVLPEDGWELLKYNFGKAPGSVFNPNGFATNLPFFALYNRYTAKLKIFAAVLSEASNAPNICGATVQITINGSMNYLLLQHASPIITVISEVPGNFMAPVLTTPNDIVQQVTSGTTGFHYYWLYGETNISYDPCVCMSMGNANEQTYMDIDVYTNTVSNVNLNIDGVLNPLNSGSGGNLYNNNQLVPKDNLNTSYEGLPDGVNVAIGAGKAALNGYKDFKGYADQMEKYFKTISVNGTSTANYPINNISNTYSSVAGLNAGNTGQNVSNVNDSLSNIATGDGLVMKLVGLAGIIAEGSTALPYIGAAIGLIDFLSQGGDEQPATTPAAVSPPTAYQLQGKITGQISSSSPYATSSASFLVPGSKPNNDFNQSGQTNEGGGGVNYPIYNNPLGILNVLEIPDFEYKEIPMTNNGIDPNIGGGFTFYDFSNTNVQQTVPGDRTPFKVYDYKMKSPLKYVLNPAANLSVQSINCAFVLEYNGNDPLYPLNDADAYTLNMPPGSFPPNYVDLMDPNNGPEYQQQKQIPYYPNMYSYYYPSGPTYDGNTLNDIMTNKLPSTGLDPEYQSGTFTNADGTNPADAIFRLRTKYVPIQALNSQDFILVGGGTNKPKLYIKLYVKLTRNDNPNSEPITMVLTYDASKKFNVATSSGVGGGGYYYYYYANGGTSNDHSILSDVHVYGANFTSFYGSQATTISTPQQTGIVANGTLTLPDYGITCAANPGVGSNTFSTTQDFNAGHDCTLIPGSTSAYLSISAVNNINIGYKSLIIPSAGLHAGNDINIAAGFTIGNSLNYVKAYAGNKILLDNNTNYIPVAQILKSRMYANNSIQVKSTASGTVVNIKESVLSIKPGAVPNIYAMMYNYDHQNALPVTAHTESSGTIQSLCTTIHGAKIATTDPAKKALIDEKASKLEQILTSPADNTRINIFPNPATSSIYVSYDLPDTKTVMINLSDITGKQVVSQKYQVSTGTNNNELAMDQLSNGAYILKMVDDKGTLIKTEKIILSR